MPPTTIILGAGIGAIAMAHTLKCQLGYTDFEIYDKQEGLGGTWRINTYPGCGSDVPVHLYSFSFNPNPDWSAVLADREEFLEYLENTVDKFDLRRFFNFNAECVGAEWDDGHWNVHFRDVVNGKLYTKQCNILISAVGGFCKLREPSFPGLDRFKGYVFHTARWDHSFDIHDKRIAVIGNGCSAAQAIPNVVGHVKKITQYARSPQWYHPRPNSSFSSLQKFAFKYLPFWQRIHRMDIFFKTDQLASVYGPDEKQVRQRLALEEEARQYIYKEAPEKYHSFIVPDFPLGCKRRIYDPGYLASLHRDNIHLLPEGIKEVTETGIISDSGREEDFDAIILATGFDVTSFLAPMNIVGKHGGSLHHQWASHRGAQAYMGTFIHNFPNFATLFGPNTFPAFNSVIFTLEIQVEYVAKALFKPTLDGYASVVEAKPEAEEDFVRKIDGELKDVVFSAGCSNWYIDKNSGRNCASWPGLSTTFWSALYFPKWKDFQYGGGSSFWVLNRVRRILLDPTLIVWLSPVAAVLWAARIVQQSELSSSQG